MNSKKIKAFFFICVFMIFNIIMINDMKVNAATQTDVAKWLESQNGKAIDYDGHYGVQCVDFFNYYLKNYWGYQNPIGMYPVSYAYQIFDKSQPSGWGKISGNSNFRTGDIVIWNSGIGGGAGHVGVIYSVDSSGVKVAHENWGAKYVTITALPSVNNIRGVFRPPLSDGNNPQGVIDGISGDVGSINISGWAFDKDDISRSIYVDVYIGGPAGSGVPCHTITANKSRPDVNNVYGVGDNHGYADKIVTDCTGTQTVYVYAINIGGGENIFLGSKQVNITKDTEQPKITRTYVSEITRDSYRVCAEISDNCGIKNVSIATWSQKGQTDLKWRPANFNGYGTYFIDIKRSEHSEIMNSLYYNHIYVYDYAGNCSVASRDMDYRIKSDTGKNIAEGEYRIVTAKDSNFALDATNGATADGTNIQIYKNTSDKSQTFNISYVGDGFYKIIGTKSGLALDVDGERYQLETNVMLGKYHEGVNQQWMFKKLSDGVYSIVSRSNGLALDFYKGIYENCTNVQVYEQHGGDDQQWRLKRVLKESMVNFNFTDVYRSNYAQLIDKIEVTVDGKKLKKDVDYDVFCMSKDGSLSYIVTGIGDYSDKVVKTYTLKEEPTTVKETTEKITTVKPTEKQTTVKPTEKQTTVKPTEKQTTVKPTEKQTTVKPTEKQTTVKPTEKQTTVKPTEKETTVKPTEKQTTVKPTEKETTVKPTEKQTTVKPTEKETTVKPTEEETTREETYTVTFMDDEKVVSTQIVKKGESARAPKLVKKGYTLSWTEDFDNIWEDTVVETDWSPNDYEIRFNAAGGKVSEKSLDVTYGENYGELPYPERGGYQFVGWYTKKSGGEEITEDTEVGITKTQTLYAHWTKVKVPKITIKKISRVNGKLKISLSTDKGEDGCQILYSVDKNFRSCKKINTSDSTEVITNLKKRTKYYIKVRGYSYDSKEKKIYGAYSKVYSVVAK